MRASRHFSRAASLLSGLLVGCNDSPAAVSEPPDAPTTQAVNDALCQGPRVRFSALAIFLEFNSTDNDLGVQVFLDAEAWDRIQAESPSGGTVLDIEALQEVGELGLTELRFESAEPSPDEVLEAIEAGRYSFSGTLVDGRCLEGRATLSHALPPAPTITSPTGADVDPDNVVVEWNPIAGLAGFEVIVANERAGRSLEVQVGPDVTSLHVPAEFMEAGADYKVEVLAVATNGNKTISEIDFSTAP